jgi:hypothetical protein
MVKMPDNLSLGEYGSIVASLAHNMQDLGTHKIT